MESRSRPMMIAAAIVLTTVGATVPAQAGDYFGVHFGTRGWGLSVGVGDWAPYGSAWGDPRWALDFDIALEPYGTWVHVSGLGRVWRPAVAVGWQPYTHGRWVWTDLGWTWVAYEPWGYIPHHYGRWAYSSYGWVWQPGFTYSPANVVWVRTASHIGWYASPPRGWSHSHRGHHHHRGYHRGYDRGYRRGYGHGYQDGWEDARYATFLEWRHMGSDNVSRHAIGKVDLARREGRATVHRMPAAPTRSDVRQRGGVRVHETRLERRQIRVGDQEVVVARPKGVADSVRRHADDTMRRAISTASAERAPSATRRDATSPGASPPQKTSTVRRPTVETRRRGAASRELHESQSHAIGRVAGRPGHGGGSRPPAAAPSGRKDLTTPVTRSSRAGSHLRRDQPRRSDNDSTKTLRARPSRETTPTVRPSSRSSSTGARGRMTTPATTPRQSTVATKRSPASTRSMSTASTRRSSDRTESVRRSGSSRDTTRVASGREGRRGSGSPKARRR